MFYCECITPGIYCELCTNKREMAQSLRNVVMRMKLAVQYKDTFNFKHEAKDLTDRIMWEQWAYLSMHQNLGFEWEIQEPRHE